MANVAEFIDEDRRAAANPASAPKVTFAGAHGHVGPDIAPREKRGSLTRSSFGSTAALADLAAILWAAIVAGGVYGYLVYGQWALRPASLRLSFIVAMTFILANIGRRNYAIANYMVLPGHARRTIAYWNIGFLVAVFMGFLDRSDAEASRGGLIAFYALGLLSLYAVRAALVHLVRRNVREGALQPSRAMIVGFEKEIEALRRRGTLREGGKAVVCVYLLRDDLTDLARDLAAAARIARKQTLDEILIVVPLSRGELVEKCIAAFLQIPAAINILLEPKSGLARFAGASVSPLGRDASLHLPSTSISFADRAVKRACDIAFASVALVIFAPLMLTAAIAIKLDSPGPALFLQTRHGYNKKTFRILKFRSMTAMEHGRDVQQATTKDMRITRVGGFMRKFNIDELPQLINVLRGEMSLVGPRPHAVPHDRKFEREVALYTRRHNVKPGITGWAQVNGLRGPTDTSEKIERRVQHDLHYVDNWSLSLDIWILMLTLFSRTAYRNAI